MNEPPPGPVTPRNTCVDAYVLKCTELGTEPVVEFIVALSDQYYDQCVLTDRKKPLGDKDATCMAAALAAGCSIAGLNLQGNEITETGAIDLAAGISANAALTHLSLAANKIGLGGARALANMLREAGVKGAPLAMLNISGNGIGNEGASALLQALYDNRTLRVLDMQRNGITCEGAIAIAAPLKVNSTLQELNLRFNQIADTGATALGEVLQVTKCLQSLDLGGNRVGDQGCTSLAGGLAANRTLVKLNLRSNRIGDAGAAALARALPTCALQEIYVGGNPIREPGCAGLATAWGASPSLVSVDMQGIPVGRTAAPAVAAALRANQTVRRLVLDLAEVEPARSVVDALRGNTSITELVFPEGLPQDLVNAIKATLKVNCFIAGLQGAADPAAAAQAAQGQAGEPSLEQVLTTMRDKLRSLASQQRLGGGDGAASRSPGVPPADGQQQPGDAADALRRVELIEQRVAEVARGMEAGMEQVLARVSGEDEALIQQRAAAALEARLGPALQEHMEALDARVQQLVHHQITAASVAAAVQTDLEGKVLETLRQSALPQLDKQACHTRTHTLEWWHQSPPHVNRS
ncbi:putative Protein NLRC3 [Paratrimastix pyriformis]|uniref:Uncharacterized protein n=1 Tax=Paratrimastix pyriformis TaxID=342808 RepID=A0ABQ8UQ15_9EUKA|nr:putative Protein NLRC3 [Paratrimastix pyriformis]